MLCRHFMPRANDAPLEQTEGGFNAVRRKVAVNIRAEGVVDATMLALVARNDHRSLIGLKVVGHNHVNIFANVFLLRCTKAWCC